MIEVHLFRDGAVVDDVVPLAAVQPLIDDPGVFVWLDAAAPSDEDIASLASPLGLHPLTVEDLLHQRQRSRVELFEHYAFVALRPLTLPDGQLEEGEMHVIVGAGFMATLRYGSPPWPIDGVVQRWSRQPEMLKAHPGGYALYKLLDAVVDGYMGIVEELEDRTDDLEDLVFADDPNIRSAEIQEQLFLVKREVVRLRRYAAPLRQGLDLLQDEPTIVHRALLPYYRDVTEHVIRVSEFADNVRDVLTSLLELRVAQVANHLNVAMRKLTAWAAILLVPTLIAGVYGMNFNIPELRWGWGYGYALALMAGTALALYLMFKRKDWL
jgi:magnesium transporter